MMKVEKIDNDEVVSYIRDVFSEHKKDKFAVSSIIYPRSVNKNEKLDNTSVLIFFRGEKIGYGIEEILKNKYGEGEGEYEVEYRGITGHIDFYRPSKNMPFEIKTCSIDPTEDDFLTKYIGYVAQLGMYMSILDSDEGVYVFFNVRNNSLHMFKLSIEKEIREEILKAALEVKNDIEAKKFSYLCVGCSTNKYCNYCDKRGLIHPIEFIIMREMLNVTE